ncbi:hypothetical protein N9920_02965 [Akkermansiaceae bacterium]|nr:hypothetical protein [Akkermansiaceae bacterium]
MLFENLRVWRDPVSRSGPENMAVDEWLTTQAEEGPILRYYDWTGDWVSFGYFQSLAEAKRLFGNEVSYVRRWTGGGIVDHREDSTYTLVMPKAEKATSLRGDEIYCAIHKAVVAALKAAGISCELAAEDSENKSAACFQKPVRWDIVAEGKKLAGAGQRRGKWGILHQGSVMGEVDQLADFFSEKVTAWEPPQLENLSDRYRSDEWLKRVT